MRGKETEWGTGKAKAKQAASGERRGRKARGGGRAGDGKEERSCINQSKVKAVGWVDGGEVGESWKGVVGNELVKLISVSAWQMEEHGVIETQRKLNTREGSMHGEV